MTGHNGGLKDQAYDVIKKRLVHCTYAPNTLLNEAQLSSSLGFSRTPIREAVIQLEQEGFLQIIPKKGIYVTAITANEIVQIFQARKEIEPVTMVMARPFVDREILADFREKFSQQSSSVTDGYQLDTAMHLYFIENCNNGFIIDMMHKVFDKNTRVIVASKQNQLHLHDSRREHLEILDSVLADDYERAVKLLVEHVNHCRIAALDNFYSSQPCTNSYEVTYKQYLDDYVNAH